MSKNSNDSSNTPTESTLRVVAGLSDQQNQINPETIYYRVVEIFGNREFDEENNILVSGFKKDNLFTEQVKIIYQNTINQFGPFRYIAEIALVGAGVAETDQPSKYKLSEARFGKYALNALIVNQETAQEVYEPANQQAIDFLYGILTDCVFKTPKSN